MINEEKVLEILKDKHEPFLHKPLLECNAIRDLKVKDDYVSLKIAIAKAATPEQMQLQMAIVNELKAAGASSVGLRFEQFTEEELAQYSKKEDEKDQTLLNNKNTTFIAIASGKGGVGKSTVSVNLAVALARQGKKVGIIDADIYGFSVPDMMGIDKRPVVRGERVIPVERFDVKVISMGFFVEDNAPVIWRGPMLGKMLNNFFSEVEWGDLDYLLLDLPPGTGDVALDVHTMLPECKEIIVTTPHATAAFVAARAGAMAIKTNHKILGVIENMSFFESKLTGEKEYVFGRGGGERLAEELKTEVFGQIPLEQPEKNDDDFAPSVYRESDRIGKIYDEIAVKVVNKLEQ